MWEMKYLAQRTGRSSSIQARLVWGKRSIACDWFLSSLLKESHAKVTTAATKRQRPGAHGDKPECDGTHEVLPRVDSAIPSLKLATSWQSCRASSFRLPRRNIGGLNERSVWSLRCFVTAAVSVQRSPT